VVSNDALPLVLGPRAELLAQPILVRSDYRSVATAWAANVEEIACRVGTECDVQISLAIRTRRRRVLAPVVIEQAGAFVSRPGHCRSSAGHRKPVAAHQDLALPDLAAFFLSVCLGFLFFLSFFWLLFPLPMSISIDRVQKQRDERRHDFMYSGIIAAATARVTTVSTLALLPARAKRTMIFIQRDQGSAGPN
jgi:hypothetical protein